MSNLIHEFTVPSYPVSVSGGQGYSVDMGDVISMVII